DLRREAAKRATHVAFTEALERAVAQLTNALACDAEHGANLFERVFAAPFETEVQFENLCVARWKRAERRFDLVVEEAVHCLFLGVRHLVRDEALDERAIAFRIYWCIEPHVARIERGERLHYIDGQTGDLRQLVRRGLATQLLTQNLGRLDDAREIGGAIERNANGATLTRERRQDCLTNPPDCIGDELHSLIRIELARSGEQTNIALTDQIDERKATVLVFLCDGDDEAQIALYQLLECVRITRADLAGDVYLFGAFEKRICADFVQVLIENVALWLARSYACR